MQRILVRRTARSRWFPLAASFFVGAVAAANAAAGWTNPGNIDHTQITQDVVGDIRVEGKIDGRSNVTLTSTSGSITIDGKIDGGSVVTLKARHDISIGAAGGGGEAKIDGGSLVTAVSDARISLGDKIDGKFRALFVPVPTRVAFRAGSGITIGNKIDGGVIVKLCTGSGKIHIRDKIDDGDTQVFFWPPGSLVVDGGIQRGTVRADKTRACSGF